MCKFNDDDVDAAAAAIIVGSMLFRVKLFIKMLRNIYLESRSLAPPRAILCGGFWFINYLQMQNT